MASSSAAPVGPDSAFREDGPSRVIVASPAATVRCTRVGSFGCVTDLLLLVLDGTGMRPVGGAETPTKPSPTPPCFDFRDNGLRLQSPTQEEVYRWRP